MDEIQTLQREINEELYHVAANLEERVEKYIPQSSQQQKDVKVRLENLKHRIDEKIALAESLINDSNQSVQSFRENSYINSSKQKSDFKFILESLCEIESSLQSLSLGLASVEQAKLLKEANEWLKSLSEEGKRTPILERIRILLHKDLTFHKSFLLTTLNHECRELISFPSSSVKGCNLMTIRVKNSTDISETLTALDILQELKGKIAKWSDTIFTDFCSVIINSRSGIDCFECKKSKNEECLFVTNVKSSPDPVDVTKVFDTLSSFFVELHYAIGHIEIGTDCRPLTIYIGRGLEQSLFDLLLKNCISIAAPMADKNDPIFKNAMDVADKFRILMIEKKFWNESAPKFLTYAEENDAVFINRRCLDILNEVKRLIMEPFINLTDVGTGDEITEELITDYSNAFGNFNIKELNIARDDQSYPRFMQLQRCKVSTSAVKIVELLEQTIQNAVMAESDILKARLLTTAQNILRLYISIAPKYHAAAITSVPQAAAIYFNNNHYICHRIILLPFLVVSKFPDEIQKLQSDVYPIVVDNVWILRESAGENLELMLANTRRNLSTILADRHMFVELNNHDKNQACHKTLQMCIATISSIRNNWKEVMADTVFCKSLGNIVSYFLSELASMFLNAEDIRASDADMSATILNQLLTQLGEFFVVDGKTYIHVYVDSAYFRLKEIVFCLNGSLQGISDRWCNLRGPLAQWLTASEVRGLIKALFMNTEQRKQLLESIC